MKPRFYGPYRVLIKVGEVAYELELLERRKIEIKDDYVLYLYSEIVNYL